MNTRSPHQRAVVLDEDEHVRRHTVRPVGEGMTAAERTRQPGRGAVMPSRYFLGRRHRHHPRAARRRRTHQQATLTTFCEQQVQRIAQTLADHGAQARTRRCLEAGGFSRSELGELEIERRPA
jgi:hypothetical protein